MSDPQMWLCLFTFRPIASKQLNGLTATDKLSVHLAAFNPGLRQGFLCLIFCFVVVVFLLVCPKTHYLSQTFAIPFTMLIYLVCVTYSKICDRLKGYKDTDLKSLTMH